MAYEIQLYQILIQSWEYCMCCGLSQDIKNPRLQLTQEELSKKLKANNNLIVKFNNFMDKHLVTLKKVESNYNVLLFDKEGYVLNTIHSQDKIDKKYRNFITPGVLYSEDSIGTNAISLIKLFRRPIFMLPQFHYCNKLKKWHEYCVPLHTNEVIQGYILVVSCYPILKVMEGFVDLIKFNLCERSISETEDNYSTKRLTGKQYIVLKMIAEGLSDEHISRELKISLSTVKYHSQNIYKILRVTGRVEAVTKALALNEINISDVAGDYSYV